MPRQLRDIRHFALDLDGTLYLGGHVFDCTIPFLRRLRELGIGYTFFTNNSSRSTREYVEHLKHMGIKASAEDLYSSTHATMDYLREKLPDARALYVLGTPALREEFAEAGWRVTSDDVGDVPDAVVVGFDRSLVYERLCRAAYWIKRGKTFLATNPDRVCPTNEPTVLVDCGSICRMITHATGIEPAAVAGKPDPRMLKGVMARHGVGAQELVVVGDRVYTDMAMARAAGAMGILVLSGETTREQVKAGDADLVVQDVGELAKML